MISTAATDNAIDLNFATGYSFHRCHRGVR